MRCVEASALFGYCAFLMQNWPQDKFPLRKVGRMVLDQNIDNLQNEAEKVAFHPGTVVPGEVHRARSLDC